MSKPEKDRRMILLEGNIGAGKTTVGRAMAASGEFGFIEEPTTAWREGFASNMLGLFYEDPQRWAFTFQICAFNTRAKTWSEVLARTDHSRVVLERSIFCDRYVFAENCYRTGLMSLTEYQLYCGMWEFLVSNYCVQPDVIVYLRTPAEMAWSAFGDAAAARRQGSRSSICINWSDCTTSGCSTSHGRWCSTAVGGGAQQSCRLGSSRCSVAR